MQGLVKKEILGSKNQEFKILEVGSYAGNSATTWAEAIQGSGQKFKIVCVDRWGSYVKPEKDMINKAPMIMDKALENDKIFKLFNYNISAAGISKMVTPIRGESDIYISLSLQGKSSPKDWDFAAPEAILKAAGGVITNLDNKELEYNNRNNEQQGFIVASNSKENHKDICSELKNLVSVSDLRNLDILNVLRLRVYIIRLYIKYISIL